MDKQRLINGVMDEEAENVYT